MRLLRDMNREDGVTIVMVTHNMDIVSATDRVVRMVGGVVTEDREPACVPHPRFLAAGVIQTGGKNVAMSSRVYLNGDLVPKLDARLSVYDHGLLFGDGVWEGMRLFRGVVFHLSDHLSLLFAAAKTVSLPLPFSADELATVIATPLPPTRRVWLRPRGRHPRAGHARPRPAEVRPAGGRVRGGRGAVSAGAI